jgi:hypothetical protein
MDLLLPLLRPLLALLLLLLLLRLPLLLLGGLLRPWIVRCKVLPLRLVSRLLSRRMNTAWMGICFAGLATSMVWILVSLLVLPINLTHPSPSTRPALIHLSGFHFSCGRR